MRASRIVGLALEGLARRPLRVTLTTLGVTIASAALAAMVGFAVGLQRQVETPFRVLALLNNVQASPRDGDDAPPLDDAALARFAALPGVEAAYPDIRVKGIRLRHGAKSETVLAVALPREASLFGIAQEILVAGRYFEEGREAILGVPLVEALGFASPEAAVGTTVAVEASGLSAAGEKSFAFERREVEVRIVGVYEAPALMPPPARRAVLLPVELMKDIPGIHVDSMVKRLRAGAIGAAQTYSSATVRVRDPADVDRVEAAIEALGYRAHSVLSRLEGMRKFFLVFQILLAAVGTIALLVAALGIVNTLLMAVLERYQEIGVYKAIGASEGDVFTLFLTEAATIGLLGGLGGLALGGLVAWGLEAAANVFARAHGVDEPLALFAFPPWLLAATVLFAVGASIVAGVYPALRAARVDPIRALRRD